MEYLPNDPSENEIKNQEKLDKKLREFREYIVDKGIVLAFVKGKAQIFKLSFVKFKIF